MFRKKRRMDIEKAPGCPNSVIYLIVCLRSSPAFLRPQFLHLPSLGLSFSCIKEELTLFRIVIIFGSIGNIGKSLDIQKIIIEIITKKDVTYEIYFCMLIECWCRKLSEYV